MRISRLLYDKMMSIEYDPYKKRRPDIYLGAKDKFGVLREAVKVVTNDNGCAAMPSIYGDDITDAYIEICKKGLIPHCLIRVFHISTDYNSSLSDYSKDKRGWGYFANGYSIFTFKAGLLTFGIHDLREYSKDDNYMIYERYPKVGTEEDWFTRDIKTIRVCVTDA